MSGELITTTEAARRLAVSPRTVRRWLATGRIAGERAGKRWRLFEGELRTALVSPHPASRDDRAARVRAVRGMFAGSSRSVDDFLAEKHLEADTQHL